MLNARRERRAGRPDREQQALRVQHLEEALLGGDRLQHAVHGGDHHGRHVAVEMQPRALQAIGPLVLHDAAEQLEQHAADRAKVLGQRAVLDVPPTETRDGTREVRQVVGALDHGREDRDQVLGLRVHVDALEQGNDGRRRREQKLVEGRAGVVADGRHGRAPRVLHQRHVLGRQKRLDEGVAHAPGALEHGHRERLLDQHALELRPTRDAGAVERTGVARIAHDARERLRHQVRELPVVRRFDAGECQLPRRFGQLVVVRCSDAAEHQRHGVEPDTNDVGREVVVVVGGAHERERQVVLGRLQVRHHEALPRHATKRPARVRAPRFDRHRK